MEKSWENFWSTGKVEDYLSYRNSVSEKDEKEKKEYGTTGNSDRDGTKRNAYF